jgi:hypothetical protein
VNAFRHWDGGIIPVKFDKEANFQPKFIEIIIKAMEYIMGVSCIKFDWKSEPQSDYVFITRAKRCSSMVKTLKLFHTNGIFIFIVHIGRKHEKGTAKYVPL